MKKILLALIAIIGIEQTIQAQQTITISPGIVVGSPTAGTSGLRFSNLNSGTTVSTTPTKVLSLDATGNVILGNAASGSGTGVAVNVPVYTNSTARSTAIPTATTGMLTYNSAGTGIETFNGTSWIPLNYWTFNSARNVVVSPSGGAVGIEANTFVSQAPSTVASPVIALAGANHVIRYARSGPELDEYALTQETTTGTQQSAASIVWKYYDNSPTPFGSVLFGYSAGQMTINGQTTISGFTKLGNEATATTLGVTSSVPSVKHKLLTGITLNNALSTAIAHGITSGSSKIVGVSVSVQGTQGNNATIYQFGPGYNTGVNNTTSGTIVNNGFTYYFDDTNIYLERSIAATSRPYKILITYTP
ncbi:MAG: hypothetical protein MUF58_00910 [Arcicella sp.]|jgi:hypothetical protein|nr:hypothetical protein [Arcicella sp.]